VEEPRIQSIISRLESIKSEAEELLKQEIRAAIGPFIIQKIHGLVYAYNRVVYDFTGIQDYYLQSSLSLPLIGDKEVNEGPLAVLTLIHKECIGGIAFLKQYLYKLSSETLDKLQSLRVRIKEDIEPFDLNLSRHLNEAIDEYEKGFYLGSSLISAKVIDYVIDLFPGKEIEDKIDALVRERIIPANKKLVTSLVNTAKYARNYFSHDIRLIADAANSLALFSHAVEFADYLTKLSQKPKAS